MATRQGRCGRQAGTWVGYLAVALATLVLDQGLKWMVATRLAPEISVPLVAPVRLTLVHNRGGAFGLDPGCQVLLVGAGVVVIAAATWYARRGGGDRGVAWALGLLAGGTGGNLVDRLRWGWVVDFIDVGFWPVFNLADCAITAGALWLAWRWLAEPPREEDR